MTATVIHAAATSDVRWCAELAQLLSICCVAPDGERAEGVRVLMAAPPAVMLPAAWSDLTDAAERWLAVWNDRAAPRFAEIRLIEKALRDMPVPVPAWAARFQ